MRAACLAHSGQCHESNHDGSIASMDMRVLSAIQDAQGRSQDCVQDQRISNPILPKPDGASLVRELSSAAGTVTNSGFAHAVEQIAKIRTG